MNRHQSKTRNLLDSVLQRIYPKTQGSGQLCFHFTNRLTFRILQMPKATTTGCIAETGRAKEAFNSFSSLLSVESLKTWTLSTEQFEFLLRHDTTFSLIKRENLFVAQTSCPSYPTQHTSSLREGVKEMLVNSEADAKTPKRNT